MYKFSNRSLKRMEGIDPRLIEIAKRALEISKIDFGIPQYGGLRSAPEQRELFNKDLSRCDGYNLESYHQSGKALDVYAYVDGKASWDSQHLMLVATAMLQAAAELGYPLKWAGLWNNFIDMPHFEFKD